MIEEPHVWNTNIQREEKTLTWLTQNGFSYQEAIQILVDERI
jgi:hypothetical protein